MSRKVKNKLVPKLRFSKFKNAGEWLYIKGDKVFDQVSKKNHNYNLPALAITQEYAAIPRIEIDYRVTVTDKSIASYKVVEIGDFIISLRSFQGGIEYSNYRGLCSPAYIVLRKNAHVSNDFYRHYFKTKFFINQLNRNIEGIRDGKMVSYKQFSELLLPKPKLSEQQKIADCLSSLDELITAQSQKFEALKTYKKWLIQQLFPAEGETMPKMRFEEFRKSEKWELLPIGNKVDSISGFAFSSITEISEDVNGIPLMRGINITEGYIRHSPDIDRYFLGDIQKLEKYKLHTGDLVIAMDGSKVGKNAAIISEVDSDSLLVQRVARLRTTEEGMIQFIFQHVNSTKFHSYVDRINTSSGIPHISLKQIEEFEVCFPPSTEERQKIAECLSSLDELIAAQTEKIQALQKHKKGLMQGLFPIINETQG